MSQNYEGLDCAAIRRGDVNGETRLVLPEELAGQRGRRHDPTTGSSSP